jgi:hypothetical protein
MKSVANGVLWRIPNDRPNICRNQSNVRFRWDSSEPSRKDVQFGESPGLSLRVLRYLNIAASVAVTLSDIWGFGCYKSSGRQATQRTADSERRLVS